MTIEKLQTPHPPSYRNIIKTLGRANHTTAQSIDSCRQLTKILNRAYNNGHTITIEIQQTPPTLPIETKSKHKVKRATRPRNQSIGAANELEY